MSLLFAVTRHRASALLLVAVMLGPSLLAASFIGVIPGQGPSAMDGQRSAHSLANLNPLFAQNLPMFISPTSGIQFNMSIKVRDGDNNTVNVTWEWGDGSPNGTNITPPAAINQWVNQTHTWTVPRQPGVGDYSVTYLLNITLNDGMGGSARTTRYANVYVPPNGYPEMSLSAPAEVDPTVNATIVGNASDPEGDSLTWTFVINNGTANVSTQVFHTATTAPNETVWDNLTYRFGVEGYFTITLYVSDALPPNQVFPHNISYSIAVRSVYNHLPSVSSVIDANPQTFLINATIGYLNVYYSIEANDMDGDILTAVWNFGDGTPTVTNTSAGGTGTYTFMQERNYTTTGRYNITVVVSDGHPGHDVSIYRVVQLISNNFPPSVASFNFVYPQNRSFALPNATINITVIMTDPESDTIQVIVNFGDNSPLQYYNLTQFVHTNTTLLLNHSYNRTGSYQISIWYTDNKVGQFNHTKYYNTTITVKYVPLTIHNYWTSWDYISLSIFFSVPAILVLWAYSGSYRRRKKERMQSLPQEGLGPSVESGLEDSTSKRHKGAE